ncbi:lasso peptide biosynthesis PqqD family chaperone [Pseudomonas panipatensis]|uniref:Coenzyme PQQ synthesis protein D (PqqD) n=1 Tax=Pseudomonas panipatensis TaxID=428992 RepID=A0A1G8LD63_9PSED|nr:lasso peptide biosynthesis PqqD family chaperone [Pseudomonas panipatensis]SDI53668.1 Coenzyme PQQ synthesis protein D (PqqD) [Pseudomonas panipatensis]SMP75132.1 Coenzyme PQQ synthesis protein D (PqqD) [Pseudomonas panipatensis]
MSELSLHSRVQRHPDLVVADMDGEVVMMSIERGCYYGIGGVGPRVWELLERPVTLEALVQRLCAEYQVDEARCRDDLLRFVGGLLDNGIVQLC